MRLPNGYGSVVKLSGNRRRPYAIRITVELDDKGRQVYKYLGYYAAQKDAIKALATYNEDPGKLDRDKITLAEVYEKWSVKKYDGLSPANVRSYKANWDKLKVLHNMRIVDIKAELLQNTMDSLDVLFPTAAKVKSLLSQLWEWAYKNDIVDRNYAEYIHIGEKNKSEKHSKFTKQEIEKLWEVVDLYSHADLVLITIYTGMRPGELVMIKNQDIDLEARTMRGGLKTAAGKNRIIPLNRKILPYIEKRMSDHEYLVLNHKGTRLTYANWYKEKFKPMMADLGMEHFPHDGRHTCTSLLDSAGANKVAMKRILGHSSSDVTENVYTHKDIEDLLEAIDHI